MNGSVLPPNVPRRAATLVLAAVLGLVAAATTAGPGPAPSTTTAAAGGLRHGRVPPAGLGGPLDLVDHHGRRFGLQQVAGRPTLLFFGFTHCGSTCPTALLTASQVLRDAPADVRPSVLFVTLEPLADGPRELATHLGRIDPRITGLTGRPEQVERAADLYGVGLRQQGGTLEHSSMWYLLDGTGRLVRVYSHTTPAEQLIADAGRLARS